MVQGKEEEKGLTVKAFQTGVLAADLGKKAQYLEVFSFYLFINQLINNFLFFFTAHQEQTAHRTSDEHMLLT